MKISGDWQKAASTQSLFAVFKSAGHTALFVGGCVRNAILGQPIDDIDIATDAIPERVMKIAADAGLRAVATGIDHGTITVIAGGIAHEVTTLRRDIQTNGRHAVVAYTDNVATDAARRDFTMNALYAQADGTVIDPLGGLPDLLAKRVRFVGDATTRITEDYLRILRFFRFHAVYGDATQGIDADGLAACAANAEGISSLSRERIGAEMKKLLAADDPAPALAAMDQTGILAQVLPGATARAIPILVHHEAGAPRHWLCRLAVIGGQDAPERLRLSRADALRLERLHAAIGSDLAPDALGWLHEAPFAGDVVHARAAVFETDLPPDWQAAASRGAEAVFPITADDLMPSLQGAALGARLRALQDQWLASGLTLSRAQLLG